MRSKFQSCMVKSGSPCIKDLITIAFAVRSAIRVLLDLQLISPTMPISTWFEIDLVDGNVGEFDLTYTMRSVGEYMREQKERKELVLFNYGTEGLVEFN